jgi:hypothetical protein
VSKYQNHGKKLGAIQKQNTLIFWKIVRKKERKIKTYCSNTIFLHPKIKKLVFQIYIEFRKHI